MQDTELSQGRDAEDAEKNHSPQRRKEPKVNKQRAKNRTFPLLRK
jgi:hypothetical protein